MRAKTTVSEPASAAVLIQTDLYRQICAFQSLFANVTLTAYRTKFPQGST